MFDIDFTPMWEPAQIPDTIEDVPVDWILQNVVFSIDGLNTWGKIDWQKVIENKSTDRHFGNLCYTIMEKGFNVPICLYWEDNKHGWAQGNGHHRMAAAILLGLSDIKVYWSDDSYMASEHTDKGRLMEGPDWAKNIPYMLEELFDG